VKLPTQEMGEVQLMLLNGWEGEWARLRGTPIGELFSVVSREVVDHALHRLSRPLVDSLGIPPEGALRKVPAVSRQCWLRLRRPGMRRACPLQGPECDIRTTKPLPHCFEPDGIEDEALRRIATQAIELWRQGVYVVVVEETLNA
jgi:hypothetical protein